MSKSWTPTIRGRRNKPFRRKIDREAPTSYQIVRKLPTLPDGSEAVVSVKVYEPVRPEP